MNTKYCVSLELAKQLKESGWAKETEFWYAIHKKIAEPYYSNCSHLVYGESELYPASDWNSFNAPLVTELLEELPDIISTKDNCWGLEIRKIKDNFRVEYYDFRIMEYSQKMIESSSLPDALAEMWIWLKKEGHIK